VGLCGNDGHEIERLVIDRHLAGKSSKCVAFTFDFISVDRSVYNCKVYASNALAQSQFLNDPGIRIAAVTALHLGYQVETNVNVTYWFSRRDA